MTCARSGEETVTRTASRPAPGRRFSALASAGAVLAVHVVVWGSGLLPAATAADLEDQRHSAEHEVTKADKHFHESSAELEAATGELLQARADLALAQADLVQAQGELSAAQARDEAMQRRLAAAEERLAAAQQAAEDARVALAEQEEQLRRFVVDSYQLGDPQLMGLSLVLTTQDPAQLAGDMNATSNVIDQQAAVLESLEAARALLEVQQIEVEAAAVEVAERREQAAENLRRKEALELAARSAAVEVEKMVDLRQQARRTAVKVKNADLRELKRLQAERDRIELLILAQAASTSAGAVGVAGDGFLDLPVDGSVTSPYGMRIHPVWGYRALHDGVDFGAACGTPIHASASGTVLSTYYQSAWGNRVIIDHGVHKGVGVATISNHLSSYAVEDGDTVRRGDVIGYVGDTGWSTGCHLHYTVLVNGVATDPMTWF